MEFVSFLPYSELTDFIVNSIVWLSGMCQEMGNGTLKP